MDAERRLIIIFIGIATLISLVALVVLVIMRRDVPDVMTSLGPTGLALLAPSPLSKSTTPPDPPPPPPPAAPTGA
jgi:hypothetical protein